jgi:hypothetical protein
VERGRWGGPGEEEKRREREAKKTVSMGDDLVVVTNG